MLRPLLTLLAGEETETDWEEEVLQARRDLEEALAALRAARASWSGTETVDLSQVRRALEVAERQLDAARARLQRAETRLRERGG